MEPAGMPLLCKLCFCGRMSPNLVAGEVKGAPASPGGIWGISAPCTLGAGGVGVEHPSPTSRSRPLLSFSQALM